MGLDIAYYSRLTPLPDVHANEYRELADYDTQWTPGASMEWSEGIWPGRGAPLDPKRVYSFEVNGRFKAGSYIGYNQWRETLKTNATFPDFVELVYFADNEGVLGPVVCAKLAEDFARNEERMAKATDNDEWFMGKYRLWRNAFEVAADGGAVDFR